MEPITLPLIYQTVNVKIVANHKKDPLILVPVVVAIILLNIHELSDIYAQLKHLEVIDNKRLETVYIVMVNPRYEICRYKNSVSRIA